MPSRSSTCSRPSRTATGGCAAAPAMRSARSADRRSSTRCCNWCATRTTTSAAPPSRFSTRPRTSARSNHLIEATRDSDWWVSERAVDALAEIGSKRAVPRLIEMLRPGNARRMPIVVRAIGKLGDAQTRGHAAAADRARREAKCASRRSRRSRSSWPMRAAPIRSRTQLQAQAASPDQTIARMAAACDDRARKRFAGITSLGSGGTAAGRGRRSRRRAVRPPQPTPAEAAKTLLIPRGDRAGDQAGATAQRASTSPRSSPATSSRAATSTSIASAAAPSAPCC